MVFAALIRDKLVVAPSLNDFPLMEYGDILTEPAG